MASRRSSYVLPALFLLCIFAGAIGGGAFLAKRLYDAQKAAFEKAVAGLPEFDMDAASQAAAKELAFAWPLEEPKASPDAVSQALEAEVKAICAERLPAKELSRQTLEIMRRYTAAKIGDNVRFQIIGDNDLISGNFLGVEDGGVSGRFVKIENGMVESKYPLRKVMPEYYHLFNEGDSLAAQEKAVAQLKSSFEAKREECAKSLTEELEPKRFKDAGYVRQDGKWVSKPFLVAEIAEKSRRQFEKERTRKLEDLRRSHAFLGVFQFDLPKGSAK